MLYKQWQEDFFMERRRGKAPRRIMQISGKTLIIQIIICIIIILFVIFAKLIDNATVNQALETVSQEFSKNYIASDFVEIGRSTLDKLKTGTTEIVANLANGGKLTDYTVPTDLPGTLMASTSDDMEGQSMQFEASQELQIYAVAGGTVSEINTNTVDSQYIKISHGNGIYSLYGGCTDIYVQSLEKVRKGQIIGSIEAGDHQLLFELWVDGKLANPTEYIDF
jgi:hypothetical protein